MFLLIFSVLNNIKKVRVGRIPCERYGHLAKNTDLFFRRVDALLLPPFHYILLSPRLKDKRIANKALLRMFLDLSKTTKGVTILRSSILYSGWKYFRLVLDKTGFWYDLTYWTRETEFAKYRSGLKFSNKEIFFGKSKLTEFGFDVEKPIVSVFTRDSAYLRKKEIGRGVDRSYHNFRNANIENYKLAIEWLIDRNFQVIRIGNVVERPLELNNPGFFDYALSSERSEELDLLIVGLSNFVFGSPSGPTDLATVLGIPYLATDYAPFQLVPLGARDMYVPKKLVNITSGKTERFKDFISVPDGIVEIPVRLSTINDGHFWKEKYGIEFCDNTPEEILSAVQEMVENLNGTIRYTDTEKCLHERYLKQYWSKNPLNVPNTPIASNFLKNNASLFF